MLTLVQSTPDVTAVDPFVQYCERLGLSVRTISAYLSDLRRYNVTPQVTPAQHADLAVRVLAESSAPSTRRRRLSALSKYFGFSHPGIQNPYREVKRPSMGVVLPGRVADPDESRTLIAFARTNATPIGYRTAAAVALMAGAGLRVGEVVSLTFGDLNPHSGSVRVVDGKGGKTRDVPMSPMVAEVVQEYAVNTFDAPPASTDRLFSCSTRTIQRDVTNMQAAVQGRNLNPHAFRHGFATAVYRATTDLRLTADLLGHASVNTTAIYTHLADDRRKDAVALAL